MFLGIEVETGQVCVLGNAASYVWGWGLSFENWNGASSAGMQVLYLSVDKEAF